MIEAERVGLSIIKAFDAIDRANGRGPTKPADKLPLIKEARALSEEEKRWFASALREEHGIIV
jgi:hypothetical protein